MKKINKVQRNKLTRLEKIYENLKDEEDRIFTEVEELELKLHRIQYKVAVAHDSLENYQMYLQDHLDLVID